MGTQEDRRSKNLGLFPSSNPGRLCEKPVSIALWPLEILLPLVGFSKLDSFVYAKGIAVPGTYP